MDKKLDYYYDKISDKSSEMAMMHMENAFKNACNLQQPLDWSGGQVLCKNIDVFELFSTFKFLLKEADCEIPCGQK